ncbi:GNAT family N-acetyltransferase [Undibacterium sp. CY21W]|uniref:GNAT family N-acetyltransferase n=1 Tax=Undibacterium sp. CY21W TaxID=2762293 RepID=UPI00164B5AB1|nr:GNAT family N-acetyltransferase [Undibacterium sp. CY21W]MBC3927707.1 GNAT family N-acetyltransferase [Undibacterium sp. CY21W]
MTNQLTQLRWQLSAFSEFNPEQLHKVYQARCAVFIVEQNCPYQDIDSKDPQSHHLVAWDDNGDIAAYLRIVPPGISYAEPSLGRVLSTQAWRGTGVGKELIANGIKALRQLYPAASVRIGAQAYLEKFYASFGFQTVSDIYLEDEIPHLIMLLPASDQ